VQGNELADTLAKQAATGEVPSHVPRVQVTEGADPYYSLWWPAYPPSPPDPAPYYIPNLTHALTEEASKHNATGGANTGVYAKLWQATAGRMDGEASNHMWQSTAVTHGARRATLQARFGVLYNANIARRMQRPYLPCPTPQTARGLCPLCAHPDSIGHMLGGCSHPTMHALYIQRHDQACRILAKAIRIGTLGGFYMLADAGTESTLAPLGICDKRIPHWLIPPPAPSRPDLLIVHATTTQLQHLMRPTTRKRTRHAPAGQLQVTIVELTYHSDHDAPGKPSQRDQDKGQQHAATKAELEKRGFLVDYQVWGLGRMGVIYQGQREAARQLGIEQPQRTLQKLHVHAVKALHQMVKTRRQLERRRGEEQLQPP
jgi:hypothetical protein